MPKQGTEILSAAAVCLQQVLIRCSFSLTQREPKRPSSLAFNSLRSDNSLGPPRFHASSPNSHRKILMPNYSPTTSPTRRNSGTFGRLLDNPFKRNKGKEKRNSAPPVLPSPHPTCHSVNNNDGISNSLKLAPPSQDLQPGLLSQNTRERPNVRQDASHTSKSFELDLSPILEDSRTFSEPLDIMEESSDASSSSYGELLDEGTTDYYSLSYYGSFGGFQMDDNAEERVNSFVQDSAQGFGYIQDTDWSRGPFQAIEESILIPELRLTIPTPEIGNTPDELAYGIHPSAGSSDDVFSDHSGNLFMSSVASFGSVNSLVWPARESDLGSGVELACDRESLGNFGTGDEICVDGTSSSDKLATGSLADALFGDYSSISRLDVPRTSGFAKKRASGDRTNKHERPFWKRFSATSTARPLSADAREHAGFARGNVETTGNTFAADRPVPSLCSLSTNLRGEAYTGDRYSNSKFSAAGPCIVEEGEHTASRLFGISNTGKVKETHRKNVKEQLHRVEKQKNSKTIRQTRRHSFGFDLKPFTGLRQYLRNSSLNDADSTTVETGFKHLWRRTGNPDK